MKDVKSPGSNFILDDVFSDYISLDKCQCLANVNLLQKKKHLTCIIMDKANYRPI